MTRTDAFSKECAAMARRAEAAGWHLNTVTHRWQHEGYARQYVSLMQLFEAHIAPKETA